MHSGGDNLGLGERSCVDGKYILQKKLSEGGGGVVWRATDTHDNEIALKTLKWSPLKSKELTAERFKNEFAIFKSLAHPNIARIFDFGHDASHDIYYFTTELLEGGDIRNFIDEPIEVIEPLLLQALRSLEFLRNAGLLHLDIKPQNFLIRPTRDGQQLVLIDFGIATFRPPDKPGGTANYMPPEIVVRRIPGLTEKYDMPAPDHRSDLYSLGVTFYYILTGEQPFYVKNNVTGRLDLTATLMQHLERDDIPPPSHYRSDIPPYLDAIIMKLMSRDPDERYPAAAIAMQALRYRSPRELEPEDMASLLSYLPKQGKMIGRVKELMIGEQAIASIAARTAHAIPILCIAGKRGVGRSRFLDHLKPYAQRMEMDAYMMDASHSSFDELTRLSKAGTESDQPTALLIDNLEAMLTPKTNGSEKSELINPLREFIYRARRAMRLSHASTPPMLIAFSINTENIALKEALSLLDIEESMVITIKLENFTENEVGEYLASLVGEGISTETTAALHRVTEGNPLVITEQLEHMISEGMLFSLAGRPDVSTWEAMGHDFESMPPPQSLTELTIARFDKLDPHAKKIASLMACWNKGVTTEDLHHTTDIGHIEDSLLKLIGMNFIQRIQENGGSYAFENPVAAHIIEAHLTENERARMHSRIANYLERYFRDQKHSIDYHRAHGANQARKFRALERLVRDAEEHRKPLEATENLETLLQLVPQHSWDMRADMLIRLGRAYEWAYMPKHATNAFRRLITLRAPKEKQGIYKIRAFEQLALAAIRRRELDNAQLYIHEALSVLGTSKKNLALRLRLKNYLAGIELRDGHADEAIEQFEDSLKRAEALTKHDRELLDNNELGEALLQAHRMQDAHNILQAELVAAEKSGNLERACSKHYLLGNILSMKEDPDTLGALKHYDKAFEIARAHRMLRMQVRLYNSIANLELNSGKFDEAIDNYQKGLSLSEQIDSKTTSVELMVGLGCSYAHHNDTDDAIEYFEAALDFMHGPMGISAGLIKRFEPTIYAHLGDAFYIKKNYKRALTYLEKAKHLDEVEELSADIKYSIYGTYADLYADTGRNVEARNLVPLLEELVKAFPIAKQHLTALQKKLH